MIDMNPNRTPTEWQAELKLICADRYPNKNGRIAAVFKEWIWDVWEKTQFLTMKDTTELYEYDEGVYKKTGERTLAEWIERNMNEAGCADQMRTGIVNEVVDSIKRQTYIERGAFTNNVEYICMQNGILDISTVEFGPHTPDIRFLSKIPIDYDPKATCPVFDRFLETTMPEQDDRDALVEFMGYCLYRALPFHKSFILIGSGANGKSTFLGCLKAFLGKDNIASISLQELETGSFALTTLIGKLANIYPDLSSKAMMTTGKFKALTGGDDIMTNVKYAEYATVSNTAKMIFSCNEIPKVNSDDTDAYFRRWAIITFPNTFLEGASDPEMGKKLQDPKEQSGIFNKAVLGLKNLLAKAMFANARSIAETRERYFKLSDPLKAFLMDEMEADDGLLVLDVEGFIEKPKLYSLYREYCGKNRHPVKIDDVFFKQLRAQVHVEYSKKTSKEGGRIWCVCGLRMRAQEPNGHSKELKQTIITEQKQAIITEMEENVIEDGGMI